MLKSKPASPSDTTGEDEDQSAVDNPGDLCRLSSDQADLFGVDGDEDTDLALLDGPIIGIERVAMGEHGANALEARRLSSPPSMTPATFAKHCVTHITCHSRCPICTTNHKPNTQNRKPREEQRVIPCIVGEYGVMRSSADAPSTLKTLLVRRIPYKSVFASVVPAKGTGRLHIVRLVSLRKQALCTLLIVQTERRPSLPCWKNP